MLGSNDKSAELHEVAQLELYSDSLKHEFLVVFSGALVWLLLVFDFRMFVEIIPLLKTCWQLTGHNLCLRNKITVDSGMVHIDST